jgi:hypothetical protein
MPTCPYKREHIAKQVPASTPQRLLHNISSAQLGGLAFPFFNKPICCPNEFGQYPLLFFYSCSRGGAMPYTSTTKPIQSTSSSPALSLPSQCITIFTTLSQDKPGPGLLHTAFSLLCEFLTAHRAYNTLTTMGIHVSWRYSPCPETQLRSAVQRMTTSDYKTQCAIHMHQLNKCCMYHQISGV